MIAFAYPFAFCSSKGRVLVGCTELTYSPTWTMTCAINHLKAAVFDVDWLYG